MNCQFRHIRCEEVGGGLVHKLIFCDAYGRYVEPRRCGDCPSISVDRARTKTGPEDIHTHTTVMGSHKTDILDYPKCLEEKKANKWFDKEVLKK
jgi:hypothetical protein